MALKNWKDYCTFRAHCIWTHFANIGLAMLYYTTFFNIKVQPALNRKREGRKKKHTLFVESGRGEKKKHTLFVKLI